MKNRGGKGMKSVLVYCLSYWIWAAWSLTGGTFLPSRLAASFIAETVVKAAIWLLPMGVCALQRDNKWHIPPVELCAAPFPWQATFISLCLTTAFLHTMHILMVGLDTWGLYQHLWIGYSLSAAVIEELAFRGLLFNLQAPTLGVRKAAVVNGLLFALYHFPEFLAGQNFMAVLGLRFWVITVMGTLFSLAFAKWKRLEMTIVIHFVWNMLCQWFVLS